MPVGRSVVLDQVEPVAGRTAAPEEYVGAVAVNVVVPLPPRYVLGWDGASLRLRARRPTTSPAPAATRRNVPGRRRAKDRTSSRISEGVRLSSHDAVAETRDATSRARSTATPDSSGVACPEAIRSSWSE